jgi:nicotinamide riboside kinase
MAFTGKKYKGSKILTDETVENRKEFYKLLNEIKEINNEEYTRLKESMFEQMFHHLSHSAQREMLEWANRANLNTFMKI